MGCLAFFMPCRENILNPVYFLYHCMALNRPEGGVHQTMPSRNRPDRDGSFKRIYERNKARILLEQDVCALCGKPVDKKLSFPNPYSPSIDHIIPIAKGGHPSDIENLQLTHLICNQLKSTKMTIEENKGLLDEEKIISNQNLPQSVNWLEYKG